MKRSISQHRFYAVMGLGALVLTLGLYGCSGSDNSPIATDSGTKVEQLSLKNPAVQSVMSIQMRHTTALMARADVIGTAVTLTAAGKPAIMLMVTSEVAKLAAPAELDGIPVEVLLTDPIVAMKGKPGGGGGVSHTAIQSAPISLGTSGSWKYDLANGYCCVGTLGSLIQVGGQKRILSNYHVFEADIVNGGNGRVATTGDPITQPGLADVNCNAANTQDVATLVVSSALPGNNVDCSSANIMSGMVDPNGSILEIGEISATTASAFVGQAVKKSGRTTGLGRSDITGLNATVSIQYENECAGGVAFTKTFTGQIVVANKRSRFLAGGDSGSLMVEDVSTNPKAIGLLFAGSRSTAIANPIDDVLNFFGATMVGN